jgi:hypothetical protein
MISDSRKTPWPWFGGKSDAAEHVWSALGDVEHYVEPFAGSLAVLLRRPRPCNRAYFSETVNDADGLLVNAWRAIQLSPDATAEAASWPVTEADLHARHLAILRWRAERDVERLMGDPAFHDPVIAGWWIWGQSAWIGSGWCSGRGRWIVGADGRITRRERDEPGVARKLPFLSADGQGVNSAAAREPGVARQLPFLSNDGQGVNSAAAREPGVARQLPFLSADGQGVNSAAAREPGVGDYHPLTMPEVLRWFAYLSARLRHVRILNGDWARACTGGAVKSLRVRQGGAAGVFLDPPYSGEVRDADLYAVDSGTVAADVRAWCVEHGDDPQIRIVLAGFDTEHVDLEARGWRAVEWFRAGFLRGGMGNTSGDNEHQQWRERLWLSPHCLGARAEAQVSLFGGVS